MPVPFLLKYKALTQAINPKFSALNLAATIREFKALEAYGKQYAFGSWAPTQTLSDSEWGGEDAKDSWQKSVDDISAPVRQAMTALIRGNLLFSNHPIPMIFDVMLGADHAIAVGAAVDNSVSPPVPAMTVTLICKR
jgi:hypothetical protein